MPHTAIITIECSTKNNLCNPNFFGPHLAVGYDGEGFEISKSAFWVLKKKGRNVKLLPFAGRALRSRCEGVPNMYSLVSIALIALTLDTYPE